MKSKPVYCRPELKAPAALVAAVAVPNPEVVEGFLSRTPALAWADELFLTACRVPDHDGHGGNISEVEKSQEGRCRVASILVKHGGNPSMANARKVTPLHMACRFGMHKLAGHLVKLGATVDVEDEKQETPLYRAVNLGYEKCVKVLLSLRANPNVQNYAGQTPLHRAVARGQVRIIPLLLRAGADPDLKDQAGKSPREYASSAKIVALFG